MSSAARSRKLPWPSLGRLTRLSSVVIRGSCLPLVCLLGLVAAFDVHGHNSREGEPVVTMTGSVPASASPDRSKMELPGWLPEQSDALLVSFAVGASMFIVLTLVGTLTIVYRNLSQIRKGFPATTSDLSNLQKGDSSAPEMSEMMRTTDSELPELEEAVEIRLSSLQKPLDFETGQKSETNENGDQNLARLKETIQRQQKQIVQYLELIALQRKELKDFHRKSLEVRSSTRHPSVSATQSGHKPSHYQHRQPSRGLSIRPA